MIPNTILQKLPPMSTQLKKDRQSETTMHVTVDVGEARSLKETFWDSLTLVQRRFTFLRLRIVIENGLRLPYC